VPAAREVAAPPPPVRCGAGLVVAADFSSLAGSVRFDAAAEVAEVRASVELQLGPDAGWPAFDLRQEIVSATFDGAGLAPSALAHRDLGAGDAHRMRAVEVACEAGSKHRLELSYLLGTPQSAGAKPPEWLGADRGVKWDLYMSDLEPGRYLEMWLPANLCHDELSICLDVEVVGTPRPHVLLANGAVEETADGRQWRVHYPARFTCLSPLLVLVPAEELERREVKADGAGGAVWATVAGVGVDQRQVCSAARDVAAWLGYFSARYGSWVHGDRFLAVLWPEPRGMEYDGATTASADALEHEVFHSWFGRGVKPARASDGWIDEAMATWATASRRAGGGRYGCEELGLDEEPALLCPPHPWSRRTPREAYASGDRLLSGLAHMAGGAAQLRSALAEWHGLHSGGLATTEGLRRHMERWCGRDLGPWWDRYVYGLS
jgi:hypothetical protein